MLKKICFLLLVLSMTFALLSCEKNTNEKLEFSPQINEDLIEIEGETPTIPEGFRLDRPEIDGIEFAMPVLNGKRTSLYGLRINPVTGKYAFHSGYDIGAKKGEEILCTLDGIIKETAFDPSGYGNYIIVKHEKGLESLYAHANEILKKEGDKVVKGEAIAKVGSTGRSTGNHLHFEIRQNNEKFDPEWILGGTYC